jgi:hypothetical protein
MLTLDGKPSGAYSVTKPKYLVAFWPLLLAGLVLASTTVSAQQDQRSRATQELLSIAIYPRSDYSQAGRVKFAQALANYCREVLALLPTNTPKEEAWVVAEGSTTDIAKINRLVKTPEFSRWRLKDDFSTCSEIAQKLIDVNDIADRNENVVRYEAANLISLATTFNDTKDIEIYASQAGLRTQFLGFELLGSVRRALLFAAMRTLEGK